MSNINDYIVNYGNNDFNELPYNRIDDMILARFSNLPFYKISLEKKETIYSIFQKFKKLKSDEFLYKGDETLIYNLGDCHRFKNMLVSNYEYKVDNINEKQFTAISIHINETEIYISYGSTDDSLTGWKEDFNLGFMDKIPSQIDGTNYLKNLSNLYNKNIRLGGHSKGGNIAIVSACNVEKSIQNRMLSISNYDGPGVTKYIADSESYQNILNKIFTIIPQNSIIGRIFEHKENFSIIESIEKGIYQHDIYSWQISGTSIVALNSCTKFSENFNEIFTDFLDKTNILERKIFVNALFTLIKSININSMSAFLQFKKINLIKMFKNNYIIEETDRKIVNKLIFSFFKISISIKMENLNIFSFNTLPLKFIKYSNLSKQN